MRTVHRSIVRCAAFAALLVLAARPVHAQVSVNGVVYTQYTFNTSDTLSSLNNFDVTRAYVNVNGSFAGGIKTRVTADVFNAGAGAGALHAFRLKYAYATWTPDGSNLTYRMGAMQTPWLDWEEALWDYRMQGTMPMERGSYVSSSDFGIGVDGKWNDDMFNFQAGVWNGENYSTTALGDKRKDFMARASYRLMGTDDGSRVGGLRLTAYGQFGQPNAGGTRSRFIGMLSYRSQNITAVAEYAVTRDSATNAATLSGFSCPANVLCNGKVMSVYGTYHFAGTRVSVIGRYDMYQTADTAIAPGSTSSDGTKSNRIIVGASYQLTPNVRLLADYDALSYDSSYTPTAAQVVAQKVVALHAQFTF